MPRNSVAKTAGMVLLTTLGLAMVVFPFTAERQGPVELYEFDENEQDFSKLHPVYTRCAKRVNMPEFAEEIQKKCGDVHELQAVAAPCSEAMQAAADHFGCCWETVMHGYENLDPEAHHAWRLWQGTLSGKAGVVFDKDSCGDAMGEHQYHALKDQVKELEDTIQQQSWEIMNLQNPEYKQGGNPQLAQAFPPRGATAARFQSQYHGLPRPN